MDVDDQDMMSTDVETCDVREKESCSSFKTSPDNDEAESGSSHSSNTSIKLLTTIPQTDILGHSKTDLQENLTSFHEVFDTPDKPELPKETVEDIIVTALQDLMAPAQQDLLEPPLQDLLKPPLDVVGDNIITVSKLCMETKPDFVQIPDSARPPVPADVLEIVQTRDVNASGESKENKSECDIEKAEGQIGGQESSDTLVDSAVEANKGEVEKEDVLTLLRPKAHSAGTVRRDDLGSRLNPKRTSPIYIISSFVGGSIDLGENAERFEDLIYWRHPKTTSMVFFTVLFLLVAMQYFSLISVMAYLSLGVLGCGFFCRLYSTSHSSENPILEFSPALSEENVRKFSDMTAYFVIDTVMSLRRLYLVDDLGDSIKFALVLWYLTYVGLWFNGMTIITISFVTIFTLPNVYERNKNAIDDWLLIWWDKWLAMTTRARNVSEESIARILNAGRHRPIPRSAVTNRNAARD